MGKLAVYKYFSLMFLVIQVIVTIFTITGLFGGNSNPVYGTINAMLVYALPLLIGANVLLLFYWLIRRRWYLTLIPILTVLCCIPYIGTMFQPRPINTNVEGVPGFMVASYNVARFGQETSGFMAQDILTEMKRNKVDVFCVQEYSDVSGDKKNSTFYADYFPYMVKGKDDMMIFSRFPIRDHKTIAFEQTNNSAMWADIDFNGKLVKVFNIHLETTGFNRTLHVAAKMAAHGQNIESNQLIHAIYGNYTMGMIIRAGQAITVANECRMSNLPNIVCGDFNDIPYSFVYNTVLGDMVDGFKECGSGWMRTYRGNKAARIDYIFHDEKLEGITYYKTDLNYSDHYPIFMKLSI